MLKKQKLFYLLVLQLCFFGLGYSSPVEQGMGVWNSWYFKGAVPQNNHFKYTLHLETRFKDKPVNFEEAIIRFAVGYQLTKSLTAWLGYSAEPGINSNRDLIYDSRLFQQLTGSIIKNKWLRLAGRIRLEERWRENQSGTSYRLRVKYSGLIPSGYKSFSYLVTEEVFFNLNHPQWVSNKAISQNRIFAGLRFNLKHNVSLDVGYLNQIQFDRHDMELNHVFYTALVVPT